MKNPIIFGDFIKVGADRADRVYEELSNVDKVKQALGDVSSPLLVSCQLMGGMFTVALRWFFVIGNIYKVWCVLQ